MSLIQRAIVLNVLKKFGVIAFINIGCGISLRQTVDTAVQRLPALMDEANTVELLWLAYIVEASAFRIKTLFSTH